MEDLEKFIKLLQYFVAHLEFCEANRIKGWGRDEKNRNIPPKVTTTRGYNEYLSKYNPKWKDDFYLTGQGYKTGNIQKQIKDWESYSNGQTICITASPANPEKSYKNAKQNYLNWKGTDYGIRAKEWDATKGTITKLVITKDKTKYENDQILAPFF